jgi:hypothetical protein
VRLSDAEFNELKSLAKLKGLSMADVLRMTLYSTHPFIEGGLKTNERK